MLKYQRSKINKPPIEGRSMVHGRRNHACTIFKSPAHDERPTAIAAGSYDGSGSNTAEIWDYTIERSIWEESKLI